MLKKIALKLRRLNDMRYSEEPSKRIKLTSMWVSPCMATNQRESLARIKRAREDLSI